MDVTLSYYSEQFNCFPIYGYEHFPVITKGAAI